MDKKHIKCSGCGASVSLTHSLCKYCGTALTGSYELTSEDQTNLKSVAASMEEKLKESKSADWISAISLIILAAIAILLFFLFNHIVDSILAGIFLNIFSFFILFLIWGFIITVSEKNIIKKAYNKKVKKLIDEYIITQGYSRYQFDTVAENSLPAKAALRKFLFEK